MNREYYQSHSLVKYLLFFFLLFISTLSVFSQDDNNNEFSDGIKYIQEQYNDLSDEFEHDQIEYDSLRLTIRELIVLRDSLFDISNDLLKKSNNINVSITALGAAPEADAPAEPEYLAKKRKDLNDDLNNIQGLITSTNVLLTDLDALIDKLNNKKTSTFLTGITSKTSSPFDKNLWQDGMSEFMSFFTIVRNGLVKNTIAVWKPENRYMNIFILLITFYLAFLTIYFPRSTFWNKIEKEFKINSIDPLVNKRIQLLIQPLFWYILSLIAAFILYWGFLEVGIIPQGYKEVFSTTIYWITAFVFIWVLAKKVFVPEMIIANYISCTKKTIKSTRYLFVGMFFFFILNKIFITWLNASEVGIHSIMLETTINTSLFAFLFFALFMKNRWKFVENDSKSVSAETIKIEKKVKIEIELFRYLGQGLAIIILTALLLEYLRFANFVYHRIVLLALFIIAFISLRTLGEWIILGITKNKTPLSKTVEIVSSKKMNFWLETSWDIIVFTLSVPVFLMVMGTDWVDIKNIFDFFSTGFKIGDTTISITNILYGIITFIVILLVFKWTASKVNKRLTEYSQIDVGVRNSIVTVINYTGAILAVFASIPVFGFDFSKLSIILGALSVGIGFGLQNIARDFVSGLILLFERPFKKGDWVVVSAGEGYIEEIRLRVTIIRTFDMANIVVPNSELVSSPVQNRFYKGKKARITIDIGVDYKSDPDQVKAILLACAKENSEVLSTPASYVYWSDFGDHALQFQLRVYVKNLDNGLTVKTDIRFAILKKFREAGINIPFPQRDLHFQNGHTVSLEDKAGYSEIVPDSKTSITKDPDTKASAKKP